MKYYTSILPLSITLITLLGIFALPAQPQWIGKDGVFAEGMLVICLLPGFYFAGLAAVATFGSPEMDKLMPPPVPSITIRQMGSKTILELSRRQFLAYLFSYLVILSFIVCMQLIVIAIIAPSLGHFKHTVYQFNNGKQIFNIIRLVGIGSVLLPLASIFVTTLHGMFFLTEKIHQP